MIWNTWKGPNTTRGTTGHSHTEQFRDGEVAKTPSQQNREDLTRVIAATEDHHQPSEFLNFTGPTQKSQWVETVKQDDGTSPTEGLGFFPAVQLPFECHPNWFNGGTGEATFEVKIMYRDGVKVGHSIVLRDAQ